MKRLKENSQLPMLSFGQGILCDFEDTERGIYKLRLGENIFHLVVTDTFFIFRKGENIFTHFNYAQFLKENVFVFTLSSDSFCINGKNLFSLEEFRNWIKIVCEGEKEDAEKCQKWGEVVRKIIENMHQEMQNLQVY